MESAEILNPGYQDTSETIKLNNSRTVLILGLLSIAGCWMFGFIGFTIGIIGLVLANNTKKTVSEMPDKYSPRSIKELKKGIFFAKIGLILSIFFMLFLFVTYLFDFFGR
jgi:hypothetical protein